MNNLNLFRDIAISTMIIMGFISLAFGYIHAPVKLDAKGVGDVLK